MHGEKLLKDKELREEIQVGERIFRNERIGVRTIHNRSTPLYKWTSKDVTLHNFLDVVNMDYGDGFSMPTLGELIPFVSQNSGSLSVGVYLVGNTLTLQTKEGMYCVDRPVRANGRPVMDERELKAKLGSREEKGVIYSDDGLVRFTRPGFKQKKQKPKDLEKNRGLITILGSEKLASVVADIADEYESHPKEKTWFAGYNPRNGISLPALSRDHAHREDGTMIVGGPGPPGGLNFVFGYCIIDRNSVYSVPLKDN